MKVYALALLSVTSATPAQATVLGSSQDLSSFSFYQRGSVGEFMNFFTKTVAERTPPNQPSSVEENNYKAHVFRNASRTPGGLSLAAVMITDLEYPYRPAFSLLTKLLDENAGLLQQLPNPSAAPSLAAASASAFGGNPSQNAQGGLPPAQKGKLEGTLASYLAKYQDPKQADTIMKVQAELDETKIVLVRKRCLWTRGACGLGLTLSTKPSNLFWSAVRSWTTSSRGQMRSPRRAKCSTRRPRSKTRAVLSCNLYRHSRYGHVHALLLSPKWSGEPKRMVLGLCS